MDQELDVFHPFLTDTLSLHKADGRLFDNIKALVSGNGILIEDVRLPIEVGDRFTRTLPNGLTDEFIVYDPGYCAKFSAIAAHHHVKMHRAGTERLASPRGTTYNVSGPNARVNFNSQDRSTNVVALENVKVFADLRKAVADTSAPDGERAKLLACIQAMEQAYRTPSFADRYHEFITAAATYMTIIGPFLPGLTALLTSH